MKRFFIFLMSMAFILNSYAEFDKTQFYVVGDATAVDWNPEGLRMTMSESGVFTWSGAMQNGRFKFLNQQDWIYGVGPAIPEGNMDIMLGVEYPLQDAPGGVDTGFFIKDGTGFYKIDVDLNELFVKVEKLSDDNLDKNQFYIVGNATSVGWSDTNALPMTKLSDGVFEWSGNLQPGEFKFLNFRQWDFGVGHNLSEGDERDFREVELGRIYPLKNSIRVDTGFIIMEEGFYSISVDLNKLEVVITKASLTFFEELWIIGDAVPGGKAKLFTDRSGIQTTLRHIGELFVGEVRFATTETIDETTQFIVPVDEPSDFHGEIAFNIVSDVNASGWNVESASTVYKVNIDFLTNLISAEIYEPLTSVYIVGDGTPVGWDPHGTIPLTQDVDDPYVFVFEGDLSCSYFPESPTRNSFKFLVQEDWLPNLCPYTEDELITESKYFMVSNGPDRRWTFSEDKQGEYKITLNLLYETIEAVFDGEVSISKEEINQLYEVVSYQGSIGVRRVDNELITSAELFDITGKKVDSASSFINGSLGNNLTNGIYILKVECNNKVSVNKVLVK